MSDKEKGLCYKVKPSLTLYKRNLGIAWCEVLQQGENINGKSCPEVRLQRLKQFSGLSEAHETVYNNYIEKYKTYAKKMGVEIVQDKVI